MRAPAVFGDHDVPLLAAGATLYAVVATVPLLLLAIRLGELVAGPGYAKALQDVAGLLPGAGGDAVRWLGRHGTHQSWGASAACALPSGLYGEGLVRSFGRLVPHSTRRPALRGRLTAVALVPGTTAVLLVAVSVASVLQDHVHSVALGIYLAFLEAWVLVTAGLLLTYRWVTPARPSWRACAWWSATTASVVAGVGLGYVLFLHLDPDVGLPFGGQKPLGLAAVAALWLWVLHGLALVGFGAATRTSRTGSSQTQVVRKRRGARSGPHNEEDL